MIKSEEIDGKDVAATEAYFFTRFAVLNCVCYTEVM